MKNGNKINLAKNIKKLMKDNGLSANQLCEKTGIRKSSLHNYLNGTLPQGLNPLISLASLFEISIDELVFFLEPKIRNDSYNQIPISEGKYEIQIKKL